MFRCPEACWLVQNLCDRGFCGPTVPESYRGRRERAAARCELHHQLYHPAGDTGKWVTPFFVHRKCRVGLEDFVRLMLGRPAPPSPQAAAVLSVGRLPQAQPMLRISFCPGLNCKHASPEPVEGGITVPALVSSGRGFLSLEMAEARHIVEVADRNTGGLLARVAPFGWSFAGLDPRIQHAYRLCDPAVPCMKPLSQLLGGKLVLVIHSHPQPRSVAGPASTPLRASGDSQLLRSTPV
jgi:hypothetical protein